MFFLLLACATAEAPGDSSPGTADPTDTGTPDTGDSGDTADTGTPRDWPELVFDVYDLEFATEWTNGPCPTDTRLDAEGLHADFRLIDASFPDGMAVGRDHFGARVWYGRDAWKVQTTTLILQDDGEAYGTTVHTEYLVCGPEGVRLAGIEERYTDPEYDRLRVSLYDPPPLVLPADRTAGSTWADSFSVSTYWWDGRAWPDSAYESSTNQLPGELVGIESISVPAGDYSGTRVLVADIPDVWVEGVGLVAHGIVGERMQLVALTEP